MGKKRIHRKPVALTFADTSNQPPDQDAEGCSSWNNTRTGEKNQRDGRRSTRLNQENGDEDEVECMGMVSSSTAGTENHRTGRLSNRELLRRQQEEDEKRIRQQEEEEFQRALELSRQEMQVTTVTNSTSDGVISNAESEDDERVQTNNGVLFLREGESDRDSSGLEDVSVVVHGEAQAQMSRKRGAVDEGCIDGDDSDATSIGDTGREVEEDEDEDEDEDDERGVAGGAGRRVMDSVDDEGNGAADEEDDGDESSVGSSILQESDEEEITAGQPPHASSSYPTQSSERAVAKVGPLDDRDTQDGSVDIFDVIEEQDQLSQELFVDSQRTFQGYEPQPESTNTKEEEASSSPIVDSRRTRLSLRKRKRDSEEGSESRTSSNKTKAPRLAQISDTEESEVNVEVREGDDDEGSSIPSSQDADFIHFPERFPDNAGVPLVDNRKPNCKSPFLTPPGVLPNAYTSAILRLFYQYKIQLLKAQAKQMRRIEFGSPVTVGPHVKDTIVHKKRGQKVFQWLVSSDEENTGNSQENIPQASDQAKLSKPLRTEIGQHSKVFQNNDNANRIKVVTGNQQTVSRSAFKPKIDWTRSVRGSPGVQNNARASVTLKTGEEVSSSRTLVSKVSPLQKNTSGEWISKSDMSGTVRSRSRLSSSDDSDADVEVVVGSVAAPRTPLTATVSPRRSTPSGSQTSNSLRSPVFGGKSSRGLVRPSSAITRQVGHCSPRTVQNNRDKMESPQPSSPRLRADNDIRTQAGLTTVAESASGVSSTVPDNGAGIVPPNINHHQEETASVKVSSGVPTSGTSADSAADPARGCPTSTNHAERDNNQSAPSGPASSKLASSSIYSTAHCFEEERLIYYLANRNLRVVRPEENGVEDVGSSNLNRSSETDDLVNEQEEKETVVQENSSIHGQSPVSDVEDNSGDVTDHLLERQDEEREENELRREDDLLDEHDDHDAAQQNSNDAAISIRNDSPIPEMDDHILDEGGGEEEIQEENVEPAQREEEHEVEQEDEEEDGDGEEERILDGVQCPLCGVTFAMTIIEVHAAECNGPVENPEPVHAEPPRRPRPVHSPARPPSPRDRMVARMEMLDRTSSEEDEDHDDDDDVLVTEAQERARPAAARKQNTRKRTFPSSENTSDSPTSSVGSMSHFDNVVLDMVRRNEIKVTAPGPSSSRHLDGNYHSSKKAKMQSKINSSHEAIIDDDYDEGEPGEVEKCFICNKYIYKSHYQLHVQNELDQMEASNSQVESSSTPSRSTRSSTALERGSDAIPSAVTTSTSRREVPAALGAPPTTGASRSRRRGDTATQGTRAKRPININGNEATSTSNFQSEKRELSSDEESGPNSPSALDAFLTDSEDDDANDEDDVDGQDQIFRDPSDIPFSDSPIKAFRSLKNNPPCLIDFKNQFDTTGGGKTPKRVTGRGGKGSGRGKGKGKSKGKWKSGKKWGRGGKS